MKLILCRSNFATSALIRFACWSRWSHSALYDPASGYVWDSTFRWGGVRKWRWADWIKHYPEYELRDSGILDIEGAREWLDDQVGKPYDWQALVGVFFRSRRWQDPLRWFCSELTEAAISIFGEPRFRADASRIHPGHQDMAI